MNVVLKSMAAIAMLLVPILMAVTCVNATEHLLAMADIAQVSSKEHLLTVNSVKQN